MTTRYFVASVVGACIALLGLVAAPPASAQNATHDRQDATTRAQTGAPDQHAMMAEMEALGKKLEALVAEMNATTGPAKVDRVAAVVTELVAMHSRMTSQMMQMMQHGAKPMMMPRPPERTGSASSSDVKPDEHSEHHTP